MRIKQLFEKLEIVIEQRRTGYIDLERKLQYVSKEGWICTTSYIRRKEKYAHIDFGELRP